MEQKVYCFFDRVSQSFMPQFFCLPNKEVAIRSFSNFANSPKFPFADIVSDIQVFQIATFSSELGMLNCDKEFICNLSDFVKEKE